MSDILSCEFNLTSSVCRTWTCIPYEIITDVNYTMACLIKGYGNNINFQKQKQQQPTDFRAKLLSKKLGEICDRNFEMIILPKNPENFSASKIFFKIYILFWIWGNRLSPSSTHLQYCCGYVFLFSSEQIERL